MERPHARIEQPVDEYDYELPQQLVDAIALADELLKRKDQGSPLTMVDIVFQSNTEAMLQEIQSGPLAHLIAPPDKNLAIESDGSYYPALDVRKQNARMTGMMLTVWGWNYEKIRYIDRTKIPCEYKKYPGEIDKVRQFEIRMGYDTGQKDGYATESLSLYFGSNSKDSIHAYSQISMPTYAETGYEGHGGKSDKRVSNEAVEWFLNFVAKNVGDQPKSTHDITSEQIEEVRLVAQAHGVCDAIDELIEGTWPAQALYLMSKPMKMLEGKSIIQCLINSDSPKKAGIAAQQVLRTYKDRT